MYLNLVRDKETGKSKGFAFLKYEDQRSCDLAVDNLGGAEVLGRILSVDHCEYKIKDGEKIYDNTGGDAEEDGNEDEANSKDDSRPVLPEELELEKLLREQDDDDPMKQYMVKRKEEEVEKALARWHRRNQRSKDSSRHHRHRRSGQEKRIRNRSEDGQDDYRNGQRRRRSRTRSPPSSSGEDDGRRLRRRESISPHSHRERGDANKRHVRRTSRSPDGILNGRDRRNRSPYNERRYNRSHRDNRRN